MDLEWLLRLARPGTLAAVVALVLATAYGNAVMRYPRQWYLAWRYPPVKDLSAQGADIAAGLEKLKSGEVEDLYRRVSAMIAQAGSQGLPVEGLQREADVALRLDTPQYRAQAVAVLSRIELEVPREKEGVQPANSDDVSLDMPTDAKPSPSARTASGPPVPARRRKRRRR